MNMRQWTKFVLLSFFPAAFGLAFNLICHTVQVSEHIERLVQLLKGEEPKISNADEELEELSTLVNTQMGTSKKSVQSAIDADDEDMRIEEIQKLTIKL